MARQVVFESIAKLLWRPNGRGTPRPLCAGSGLARVARGFWVVADDLNHVVFFPDGGGLGRGQRLFPGVLPQDAVKRKKVKKDLESLIDLGDGRLVAFPSGSKNRRGRGSVITLDARGRFRKAKEVNFRPLIDLLEKSIPDLNIEGGFVRGRRLVLLQRGNGRAGFNGVAKLRLKGFLRGLKGRWRRSDLDPKIKKVELGRLGGIPLGFTDGFCRDGVAYFAAAAEGGKDTYRDGQVMGSVVGRLGRGGKTAVLARLPKLKIEGLASGREIDGELEIFAVTDADNPRKSSRLLRTRIN